MAEGIYQKFLGLPSQAVAPDYYQILGVPSDPVDQALLLQRIDEREARLSGLKDANPTLVAHLARVLDQVRVTLSDEKKREEYDGELQRRRMRDLNIYVEKLLSKELFLTAAREDALLGRLEKFGLDTSAARPLVEERVRQLGGTREGRVELDEQALLQADVDLTEIMCGVTEEQLLADLPPSNAETAPEPPPPKVSEERRQDVADEKLKEKVFALETENKRLSRAEGVNSPRARRRTRCLVAGFFIALAYIAGKLLLDLSPEAMAKIDTFLAEIPRSRMEWILSMEGLLSVAGGVAILMILVLVFSGFRNVFAFMVPTFLLMQVALFSGTIQVGQERQLEARVAQMEETLSNEKKQAAIERAGIEAENETLGKALLEEKMQVDQLRKEILEREKEVEDALVRIAFKDDAIKRRNKEREKETAGYLARIKKITDKLAIVISENKAMKGLQTEKAGIISTLRRERLELDRTLRAQRNEIARLKRNQR